MKMNKPYKMIRAAVLCATACLLPLSSAAIRSPQDYFGFAIGADKKLVRYDRIVEYMEYVDKESDRVRVRRLGPTTLGNPFILVEVSSPETLTRSDHFKALERKLYFQGGPPTEAEREEIFRTGKAVVAITNSVHATEIGASQMSLDAIYKLAPMTHQP